MHPGSSRTGDLRRRARRAGAAACVALLAAACRDGAPAGRTAATTTTLTGPAPTTTGAPTTTVAPTTTGAPATTTGAPATTAPPTSGAAATATSPITTRTPGPLFGAGVGAATDDALAKITAALGAPTADTGWAVGCPLDSPTDANERLVTWQHLRVLFRRETARGAGTLAGYGYVLPEGDSPAPGDAALRLALPNGVALGMPMSQVAAAVGAAAKVNTTFGWVEVVTPGVTFTGDGKDPSAKLDAVSVPRVFSCE